MSIQSRKTGRCRSSSSGCQVGTVGLDPVVRVGVGSVGARVGSTGTPHSEESSMSAVLARCVSFGSSDLGIRSRRLFPTSLYMVVLILGLSGDHEPSSWERVAP